MNCTNTVQQKDGEKPIPNDIVWGQDCPAKPIVCPVKVDGKCPPGCRLCKDFAAEMESGK